MRTNELRERIEKIGVLLDIYEEETKKVVGEAEAETKKTEIEVTKEQLLDELLKARKLLRDMEYETENV